MFLICSNKTVNQNPDFDSGNSNAPLVTYHWFDFQTLKLQLYGWAIYVEKLISFLEKQTELMFGGD